MTRQDEHSNDLVAAAIDAVRKTPVPDGPPRSVRAAILAAGNELDQPTRLNIAFQRRRIVKRTIEACIAMAAVAVALLLVPGLLSSRHDNKLFAEAVKQMQAAQSGRWTIEHISQAWNQDKSQTWLKKHLMRSYFKAPGYSRLERLNEKGEIESVEIDDALAGKHLEYDMNTKQSKLINRPPQPPPGKDAPADMFTRLKGRVNEEDAVSLGKKKIDGREAAGFRVEQIEGNPDSTIDFWLDVKSGQMVYILVPGAHKFDPEADPIRNNPAGVEHESRALGLVMRDMAFDVELDDALFSLEPPAGFATETKTKHELTEKDIVEWIGAIAEVNGEFPEKPKVDVDTLNKISRKDESLWTPNEKLLIEHELQSGLGLVYWDLVGRFVSQLPRDSWHYAGKGVKVGDGTKPVFWYKPKDAKSFRVMYGDMKVKDVDEKDLPKE